MTIDYALPAGIVKPPWDPSHFQVQRNGTRGYADTLPPCAFIPDPHTDPVPGYSSLKPSKPFRKSVTVGDRKYTVPLDWYRAGEWFKNDDNAEALLDDSANAWTAFYTGVHVQRDRDFARGHAIHAAAEAALVGQGVLNVNPDAAPYIPHLTKWIDDNVTDVHAIEAVVFGDGYGGTGDAWLNVRGVSCYVDWKSRGADSAHGIYEEEIAQGGAYTSARYCILPSDDRQTAVRALIPAASYGLVLSIRPDGVAEYWYDLDRAQDAFAEMHRAYQATSDSGKAARAAKLKDPTSTIETAKRKTKPTPTATATVAPAEGDPVTDVDDIRTRYLALDPVARAWVDGKRSEALSAGVDFHLANNYTQRRLAIMSGLITLAEHQATDDDLTIILEPYAVPTVGHLDHTQADDFAAICTRYAGTPATTAQVADLFGATEGEGAA